MGFLLNSQDTRVVLSSEHAYKLLSRYSAAAAAAAASGIVTSANSASLYSHSAFSPSSVSQPTSLPSSSSSSGDMTPCFPGWPKVAWINTDQLGSFSKPPRDWTPPDRLPHEETMYIEVLLFTHPTLALTTSPSSLLCREY
ncbi:unnamed protein product [Protopolystoma xenopodis]|uniref:Uncharacterized protein n=1 Tax=Protopolystoma xenopodis TaxID=117903 RepID=A0A3S5BVL0_9PLAT|nr:unnamed protein product [Protopolystoma xenopodis]